MTAIVINYNVLWLIISSLVALIFAPPLWWLAYELHVQNQLEKEVREYWRNLPDDDEEKAELAMDSQVR